MDSALSMIRSHSHGVGVEDNTTPTSALSGGGKNARLEKMRLKVKGAHKPFH